MGGTCPVRFTPSTAGCCQCVWAGVGLNHNTGSARTASRHRGVAACGAGDDGRAPLGAAQAGRARQGAGRAGAVLHRHPLSTGQCRGCLWCASVRWSRAQCRTAAIRLHTVSDGLGVCSVQLQTIMH